MKIKKPGQVKLERAFSKLGILSRTQARELILKGQVKVNGIIRKDPGFLLNLNKAQLEILNQAIKKNSFRAIAFYKPKGLITTRSDEKGRATIYSALGPQEQQLMAVGRLDQATSGLLILTNHNQLANFLTDPINNIIRVYLVTVRGEVSADTIFQLESGISLDGEQLKAERITIRKKSKKETHLVVELGTGKNREIRRMLATQGHEVTKLKRIAFGELELDQLKPGEFREISAAEINRVFNFKIKTKF